MALLALEALPDGALSLALVGVWVLGGVAAAPVALGGFATAGWVMIVAIFGIGAAVASCGLLCPAGALGRHARAGAASPGRSPCSGRSG